MEWEEIRDKIIIALGEMIVEKFKRTKIKNEEDWKKFSDKVERIDKIKKELEEIYNE
ncbi:hypothetical protein ES703_117183 [subsurface metagenome]